MQTLKFLNYSELAKHICGFKDKVVTVVMFKDDICSLLTEVIAQNEINSSYTTFFDKDTYNKEYYLIIEDNSVFVRPVYHIGTKTHKDKIGRVDSDIMYFDGDVSSKIAIKNKKFYPHCKQCEIEWVSEETKISSISELTTANNKDSHEKYETYFNDCPEAKFDYYETTSNYKDFNKKNSLFNDCKDCCYDCTTCPNQFLDNNFFDFIEYVFDHNN